MSKVALITGITGQDGSYLAELLIEKNYQVWGLIRKSSATNKMQNISAILNHPNLFLRYGDLTESSCITNILNEIKDVYNTNLFRLEIYNLAAISHVGLSHQMPEYTGNVNGLGVLRLLEAIRVSGFTDKIRFYQASTSELYGKVNNHFIQNEDTPFHPRSPYAIAKCFAYWTTVNYREAHHMYTCNGILFNHEGPRRDEIFVTRKITKGLADIVHGRKDKLVLGNINSFRDWGKASNYVKGMWLMLQQDVADDYVLCSNETHQVREFIEKAFRYKGFDIQWEGTGVNEVGIDKNTGRKLIFISEEFYRPAEVDLLHGDCSKAASVLGWKDVYDFESLIHEMVDHDFI